MCQESWFDIKHFYAFKVDSYLQPNRTKFPKLSQPSASSYPPSCYQLLQQESLDSLYWHQWQFPHPHSLYKETVHWLKRGQCQGNKDLITPWRVKCIWSKTLLNPHVWGTGPALTPTCWPLGWGGREMQSSPQRLQWGQRRHHQGESQQTGQSSPWPDTVHKLQNLFPIVGTKKNYSKNHDGKMSSFRKKEEDYLLSNTKRNFSCLYS